MIWALLYISPNIKLGQSITEQILSNQTAYGLWGLYSSAARDSGLVEGNDRTITPLGQSIVDDVLQHLDCKDTLMEMISKDDEFIERAKLDELAEGYKFAIQHKTVRKKLLEALLSANDPNGVQFDLWSITQKIYLNDSRLPDDVNSFIERVIRESGPQSSLGKHLKNILEIERVLVAANNIFHYCRRKDGELFAVVQKSLNAKYNYSHLPQSLPDGDFPRKESLASILVAFHKGEILQIVCEIINLNKEVMKHRGGAPWLELDCGKKIRVKVKFEKAILASQDQIENRWDYDYFLGSYLNIARNHMKVN